MIKLLDGDKAALIIGDRTVTYRELIQKIHAFSKVLEGKSGRIIIFSENREAWIYAFYASWLNGLVPVPVDFLTVERDLRYIFEDCKPSIIFCSLERKQLVDLVMHDLDWSPEILILDDFEAVNAIDQPVSITFPGNPEDTAVIIYTSGTTGKSKGVMLSFANLHANIDAVCTRVQIFTPTDVILMLLPLHHILPLLGTMIMPLSVGGTIAISPSMVSEDIIRTLNDNKVTIIIGVPRLYASIHKGIMDKIAKSSIAKLLFSLASKINSLEFSRKIFASVQKKFGGNIKYMVAGGAALDTTVARDFRTLGFEILEGYGMTEAAPMISFSHPGKVKIGSAGFLLYCTQAEIRDNEIVVKGANIMQGYYNKPEDTSEVLKDGWLYTGDLGYIDDQGYLFITGRKKEIMVLSNGKKINPIAIEELLESISPVIKEAGVFQDGDRIHAIVVPDLQKAHELTIGDINKYMVQQVLNTYNHSVEPYKMIMQLSVSEVELPRTRLGKIQRYLLPTLAVEKQKPSGQKQEIGLQEYLIIKDYIQQEKKMDVYPDQHLVMDLGLDSLERVGLQVFIESSFGISIEMAQLIRFENVLQLSEYMHQNKKHTVFEKINWSNILKQKIQLKLPATWITSNIAVKISHLFFKLFFRFKGIGIENIPPEPFIIAPNHQSFLDGLFVAAHLKYNQMRKTFFYAKENHVHNPILKFFANRNNIIVMDLNNNLKESIQKMAEVLKKNKNIVIFPEGTRTKDGSLGDFKKTFAILSCELNIPIVPVSICGAYEAMPRGRVFPKLFRSIKVEFMSPVFPEHHSYDSLSDFVRKRIELTLDNCNKQ